MSTITFFFMLHSFKLLSCKKTSIPFNIFIVHMSYFAGFIALRFASFSSHRLPLLFGDWSEEKYGALSIAVKTSRSKYETYIMQDRIWFDRVSIGHVVGVFYSLIIVQHDGLTFFNTSLVDLLTPLLLNWWSWQPYKVIVLITSF